MSMLARLLILSCTLLVAACALQPQVEEDGFVTAIDTPHTIDLTQDPDDVWVRIRRGFAIPNLNSPLVDEWTAYYAKNATSVLTMSERDSKYLYFIVDELERRGMPTELALLPFVESAFNPTAYSRAHASGLWQFIPSTGKHYNLRQDNWLDERRDPVASNYAALDYLSYLFEFQGDWHLALASYNWGEGAVRRAIEKNQKQGLDTDYLSLKMPNETRNYVPKLQAIKNIIYNPVAYNIQLPAVNNEPYFTILHRPTHMDIQIAAALANMPLEEFTFLNPAYTRDVIPLDRPIILLPKENARLFKNNLQAYQGKLSRWAVYEPQAGESYSEIAKRFGMSLQQLRRINHLGSKAQRAAADQVLLVAHQEPVPEQQQVLGVQVAALEELPVFAQHSQHTRSDTQQPLSQAQKRIRATLDAHTQVSTEQPDARQHIVQRGDTLYGLARRYNSSVQAIQKLNNMRGHHLPLGKRLLIPS